MGCNKSQETPARTKKNDQSNCLNINSNQLEFKKSSEKIKTTDIERLERVLMKTWTGCKMSDLKLTFQLIRRLEKKENQGKTAEDEKGLKEIIGIYRKELLDGEKEGFSENRNQGVSSIDSQANHNNRISLFFISEPVIITPESSDITEKQVVISREIWESASKPTIRPQFLTFRRKNFKKSVTISPMKPFQIKEKQPATRTGRLSGIIKEKSSDFTQCEANSLRFKKVKKNRFELFLLDLDPISSQDLSESNFTHFELKEILEICEEMIQLKSKIDEQDLKELRKPKEFSEFFIEFVSFKLGQHQVTHLVQAIFLCKNNQNIEIVKKLLGICEDCYLTLPFSVYLCQLYSYFDKLQKNTQKMLKNYQKLQQITRSSRSPIRSIPSIKRSELSHSPLRSSITQNELETGQNQHRSNFLSNQPDQVQNEKQVTLFQIFEYIHRHFKDQAITSYIIPKLCPSSLSFNEFLMFYSVYKSKKSGCNIFKLSNKDYLSAILNFIDFPVTPEQESSLNHFLTSSSKSYLKSMLSSTSHSENIIDNKFWITRSLFLSVILKAFENFKDLTIAGISEIIQNKPFLNSEDFWNVVSECDPVISQSEAFQLFESQAAGLEEVSSDWLVEVLISSGIGFLKYFSNF